MSEDEANTKAQYMFDNTKGKKVKFEVTKVDGSVTTEMKWSGGTESEMFNKLEEIAKKPRPQTPVLNASITKSLEPRFVNNDVI